MSPSYISNKRTTISSKRPRRIRRTRSGSKIIPCRLRNRAKQRHSQVQEGGSGVLEEDSLAKYHRTCWTQHSNSGECSRTFRAMSKPNHGPHCGACNYCHVETFRDLLIILQHKYRYHVRSNITTVLHLSLLWSEPKLGSRPTCAVSSSSVNSQSGSLRPACSTVHKQVASSYSSPPHLHLHFQMKSLQR
jgi:hypothetical protein